MIGKILASTKVFLVFLFILNVLLPGCEEEEQPELPALATLSITNVTPNSATIVSSVSDDGGAGIISRGICWDTSSEATTDLTTKTDDGGSLGSFSSGIESLNPGTKYFVRAYAVNAAGTAYGNELDFTTPATVPQVTTNLVNDITHNSAMVGGTITNTGGLTILSKGVCWGTSPGPTVMLTTKLLDNSTELNFESLIPELSAGTKYYVRAFATNKDGVGYGNEITFSTSATLPTISTVQATDVSKNSAKIDGVISDDGGAAIITYGVCWNTATQPTVSLPTKTEDSNNHGGPFSNIIRNLTPATTYYVRAYATNGAGTSYGEELVFKTLDIPTVQTVLSSITKFTVVTTNSATSDGGAIITSRGVCWSTTPSPSIDSDFLTSDGAGTGDFESTTHGLLPGTAYYIRAYATNSQGTAYGNEIEFTTNTVDTNLTVGQPYAGGFIFYLDGSGQHGLVSAPIDQANVVWGCQDVHVPTSVLIGTGLQNTQSIINSCPGENNAARVCSDLNLFGYDDWFLPSKDELHLMYQNLYLNGKGNFNSQKIYRSSSQVESNSAWTQQFTDGVQYNLWKSSAVNIRAVRGF